MMVDLNIFYAWMVNSEGHNEVEKLVDLAKHHNVVIIPFGGLFAFI